MKRIMFSAIALLTATAAGAQPAPQAPPTVEISSDVVIRTLEYLKKLPYDQVADLIGDIKNCISVQIPSPTGVLVSYGQCPAVSQAIRDRQAEKTKPAAQPVAPAAGATAPSPPSGPVTTPAMKLPSATLATPQKAPEQN